VSVGQAYIYRIADDLLDVGFGFATRNPEQSCKDSLSEPSIKLKAAYKEASMSVDNV
jgi:hypothetical protein